MNNQRIHILFNRYLSGQLDATGRNELFRLLGSPAITDSDALRSAIDNAWTETAPYEDTSSEAGLRRIQHVMAQIRQQQQRIQRPRYWVWAAAAALLLTGIALFWNIPVTTDSPSVTPHSMVHTVTTDHGQQKRIQLPDSSIIYLNGGSSLSYTDDFNRTSRSVILSGEAFFEIRKNMDLPFTVRHDSLLTEVLGTSFNVSAFSDESDIRVTLVSGKVQVHVSSTMPHTPTAPTQLSPLEQFTYHRTSQQITVRKVHDASLLTAWKDRTLVLPDIDFERVAVLLERWYGVTVSFGDAGLKRYRFTGTFEDLPINRVLDLLQKSNAFTYRITEKKVRITRSGQE